jgi:hypothetical protein
MFNRVDIYFLTELIKWVEKLAIGLVDKVSNVFFLLIKCFIKEECSVFYLHARLIEGS